MRRCIGLAELGIGHVAPNPMVGAVLVHNEHIIGEGYHQQFGEAHAERNCLASVRPEDRNLIGDSVMYVSLEPCAHLGKTPPCADLIIQHRIPKVVIGCRDPFEQVNGQGIDKLKIAGVEIVEGVLENACRELNKRFICFHTQHRPYIILKWAQTSNRKIGGEEGRLRITNEFTNRIVHRWRSEESAILVGTNTARQDDPQLTTRLWPGRNATRVVIDMDLSLPSFLNLFNEEAKTIVFNAKVHEEKKNITFYQVTEDVSLVQQITNALYQLKIQSVIVEGGFRLLQSFIDEGCWDEARIITNEDMMIQNGLSAPDPGAAIRMTQQKILSDHIQVFKSPNLDYI